MVRTVLLAIAMLGVSSDAGADAALFEALYGHRHDAAAESLASDSVAGSGAGVPVAGEADPICGLEVAGELVLDRDVFCADFPGLTLAPGATLDLNGFTFEGSIDVVAGATIRNGTIARGHIECSRAACLLEDLRVIDGEDFVVEAGTNTRIDRCYFSGNDVAVDLFFFGSDSFVVIESSTFENNGIAINNSKHNHLTVSGSVFRENRVGVRLYAELGIAASFNTIVDNEFAGNDVGVAFLFHRCHGSDIPGPCHDGNVVAGNRFEGNRSSGVLFGGDDCNEFADCTKVDASIEDNFFSDNGFDSTHPLPGIDDGLTVLGPPDVVDEVLVAGNVAVSNRDLGIEAAGAIDGGGNLASGNGNPLQCVGVACTSYWPVIEVMPREHDFGQVDLGTGAAQIVTISNVGGSNLTVEDVEILPGADPGFELEEAPSLPAAVAPGGSIDVVVGFAPEIGGDATATLRIASDDAEEPVIDAPLGGTGISFAEQAMALLDFFDAAVASGDLVGRGRGQLRLFRHLIESTGELLERGRTHAACAQLRVARLFADGEFPPPDFVRGPGRPELEAEFAELRSNLGVRCRRAAD